ncbi:MAG: ABC transporter ATP-binding protein [Anaerolineales bacterium]
MTRGRPVLEVRQVSLTYPGAEGPVQALEKTSLRVFPEEFMAIVGPSGSGKTSLLRLMAGLLAPTEGEIIFEGQVLAGPRGSVGFVFQQANLMPWRTALENVRLPLEVGSRPAEEGTRRAREMLDLVGLHGFESALPRDLSGGMAQRIALGRALIHRPDLLLLDEPFGSLDALTREQMQAELIRIWESHRVTVIMVTHSIPEAILLADRVLVLSPRPGRVCLELPVRLARPRRLAMTYTSRFSALARKARAAVG